jgi:hypothetical protein
MIRGGRIDMALSRAAQQSPSSEPDQRDQAAAEQIWQHRTYAGYTFEAGQFVALRAGEVVAVGATREEVAAALAAEQDILSGLIVQVAEPDLDVIR